MSMSAPYNSETLSKIRGYAANEIPPGYVAASLGWDMAMLERVANRHQIDFRKIKKPEPKKEPEMRWDGMHIWVGSKKVRVPAMEGRIFAVLMRAPAYPWTFQQLAVRAEVPESTLRTHIFMLRRSLKSIGLKITNRPYRLQRL